MGNNYSNQIAELSQLNVIPMEDLIALGSEWKESHSKNFSIISSVSGITSTISSSVLIWMIMRSHQGLSTTQHRLLLGLCFYDIISSLSYSTFNAALSSDVNYWVWNARGNKTTCDAQGFLVMWGVFGGLYYNAALSLYFLAVVKFEKSDEYIRTKIEPFLHAVPILTSFMYSIYLLVGKHYNVGITTCTLSYHYPPHCYGYDVGETPPGFDIPCGRGLDGAMTDAVCRVVLMFLPIIIIFISLGIIYRAVRTQEKKLAGYASFRSNLSQSVLRTSTLASSMNTTRSNHSDQHGRDGLMGSIRSSLSRRWSTLMPSLATATTTTTTAPQIRSNDTQSKSRAVMDKAFGYSFAWILSYGVNIVAFVLRIARSSSSSSFGPITFYYIMWIFLPLQGLFNLAIYMYPKVIHAKRQGRGDDVSWCEAVNKAFWSRGSIPKRNRRQSNLRGAGTSSNRHTRSNRPLPLRTNMGYHHTTSTADSGARQFSTSSTPIQQRRREMRIKKKKPRGEPQAEEEKCEIQPPDDINVTAPSHHKRHRVSFATFVSKLPVPTGVTTDDDDDDDDVKKHEEVVKQLGESEGKIEDKDEDVDEEDVNHEVTKEGEEEEEDDDDDNDDGKCEVQPTALDRINMI
eukprot:CAMPEP_0204617500 /NCGR_PEP_ID=MMETSP0717-20131115/4462_1 /ASSEMBLY_ACC=CAM_ASM_000666 /TAXON_ID=230516 /ORGANISM="Chaetoceros curvisetus" /LENGTH=627 /DNA_ID=CAMNT_0051631055 /DNA_START=48 /DNA_END=1931 /DNA_ORIENTATION=+